LFAFSFYQNAVTTKHMTLIVNTATALHWHCTGITFGRATTSFTRWAFMNQLGITTSLSKTVTTEKQK
jgi:hypothetical protein